MDFNSTEKLCKFLQESQGRKNSGGIDEACEDLLTFGLRLLISDPFRASNFVLKLNILLHSRSHLRHFPCRSYPPEQHLITVSRNEDEIYCHYAAVLRYKQKWWGGVTLECLPVILSLMWDDGFYSLNCRNWSSHLNKHKILDYFIFTIVTHFWAYRAAILATSAQSCVCVCVFLQGRHRWINRG